MLFFSHFEIYKYAFPLFLIYSFDNDDMKSSKRHVVLVWLIFLLKCVSKSFFITKLKLQCLRKDERNVKREQKVDCELREEGELGITLEISHG